MGDSSSDKVKTKIIEMIYSWTVAFPNEAKISEAYQTLKRQGENLPISPCSQLVMNQVLIYVESDDHVDSCWI